MRLLLSLALVLFGCSPGSAPEEAFPTKAPTLARDPALQTAQIARSVVDFHLSRRGEASEGEYLVVLTPTLRACPVSEGENFGTWECLPTQILEQVENLGLPPLAPSELRAAFIAANERSTEVTLSSLDSARLVSAEEVERIFKEGGWWDDFYREYPGSIGYLKLSSPGLSRDGSKAVVYAHHHCGGLCGTGRILHLSRTETGWSITSERMLWIS